MQHRVALAGRSVFTLTPLCAAISLKLRPSNSWATNTSRCSSGSSSIASSSSSSSTPRAYSASGPGVRRRKQVLEPKQLVVLVHRADVAEGLGRLLAKKVRDAIARHPEQPSGDVVDRHQQPIGFDELVEDVLQNVLGIARVRHAPKNEIPQSRPLPRDDFGDTAGPARVPSAPRWPRSSPADVDD